MTNHLLFTPIVCLFIYILYKCFFERRYKWLRYDDSYCPHTHITTTTIIYIDKLESGIQTEVLKTSSITRHIVDQHFASKNRVHRSNFLNFKKGSR